MKTTPFTETHIALGRKVQRILQVIICLLNIRELLSEHLTVCNAVGVFDVSHMGEFWVKGSNALEFLSASDFKQCGDFARR